MVILGIWAARVWAVRNAVIFSQGILQQDNHIFIFSPVDKLLKSAIKLEVRAILNARLGCGN